METLEIIFANILPVALTILVPALLILGVFVAKKVSDALGIKNSQLIEDSVMNIVSQAVSYAEQMSANLAKKNEELHGQDKLNVALEYAFAELEKMGLVKLASEELTRKVEAVLGSRLIEPEVILPPEATTEGDKDEDAQ